MKTLIASLLLSTTLFLIPGGGTGGVNAAAAIHLNDVPLPRAVEPIVITDDPGGSVDDQIKWMERLRASKIPVRITGVCVSACTMILSLPSDLICATEDASFGFHAAYDVRTGNVIREMTVKMARTFYPKSVREWFMKNIIAPLDAGADKAKGKPFKTENKLKWLEADELIKMGAIKKCSTN